MSLYRRVGRLRMQIRPLALRIAVDRILGWLRGFPGQLRQRKLDRANHLIGLGRAAEAVCAFRCVLDREPHSIAARYGLGVALLTAGSLDEAVRTFEAVLPDDPDHLQTYINLGSAHHLSGRLDEATAVWRQGMAVQERLATAALIDPHGTRYLSASWTNSIGHLSLLDFFAKRQILGLSPAQRYMVLAEPRHIANEAYLRFWRPWFEIASAPAEIAEHVVRSNLAEDYPTVLSVGGDWLWLHDAMALVQARWDEERRVPLLALDGEQRRRGRTCLAELGMPEDAWFATLHVREGGFDQQSAGRSRRNADIADYGAAIERVLDRGGWIVRLGDRSMKPLPTRFGVVDYAHSHAKSDWMDIFLCAAPKLFIGTNSGPAWVASTFGVPCLLTNWAPMAIQSHYSTSLAVPQLLFCEREQRFLSFAEQLVPPLGHTEWESVLAAEGVRCVPNRPEEIAAATNEILDRLAGTYASTSDDETRAAQYVAILRRFRIATRSTPAASFLARHAHLL